MKQRRESLSGILDNIDDLVWSIAPAERQVYVNAAARRILGHEPETYLENPALWYDLLAADDLEMLRRLAGTVLATRAPAEVDVRLQIPGGARWLHVRMLAGHGHEHEDGQTENGQTEDGATGDVRPARLDVIATDITACKQAEEARDQALAAARLRSEFLATMSHELRAPLNTIIGATGLLLDSDLTETQREYAETGRHSGEVLLALINDILDVSKIEAGKLDLEEQPFALQDCIEDACDLVLPLATEKDLVLTYEVTPGTPRTFVGDPARLQQILVNLLYNAAKFTEHGQVALTVEPTLSTIATDGSQVLHFAVQDTGIGIAPDQMARLFSPFTQGDASVNRRFGGTGLGLSIANHLAQLMGGRVWAESELDRGSTFHVTVRLRLAAEQMSSRLAPDEIAAKQLLVVAGSAKERETMVHWLESWGAHVTISSTACEALVILATGQFAAVILDLTGSSSEDHLLAAALRGQSPGHTALLLVVDPHDPGLAAEWYRQLPSARTLTRPLRASSLHDTLSDVLGHALHKVDSQYAGLLRGRGRAATHSLRILLAEDSLVNQKIALYLLERIGYRADVVTNGEDVLAALQSRPYDVVLLDVQMPGMDGLQAATLIRSTYPPARRPRLIAMTAHTLHGNRERFLAAGIDDYIAKPMRSQELANVLAACVPLSESTGAAATLDDQAGATPGDLSPALDPTALAALQEIFGCGPEQAIAETGRLLLDYAQPLLAAMQHALARQDGGEIADGAHALKSSSANAAALRLSALSDELESLATAGRLAKCETKLAEVEAEFTRVKAAIEHALAGKEFLK